MHVYTLRRELTVPGTLDEVFTFFERPENLERITPDALRFRILTPQPITMQVGTVIDYALRVRGLPMHWRTLITHYDPPHGFIDEQLKGPYAMWRHVHRFIPVEGGVRLTDDVTYALPFGPLGRLVHAVSVRRDVNAIFDQRSRVIPQLMAQSRNAA